MMRAELDKFTGFVNETMRRSTLLQLAALPALIEGVLNLLRVIVEHVEALEKRNRK